MAATYEPIATQTLGSAANSITFSSIAASWTDLRLVLTPQATATVTDYSLFTRFNSDSTNNYSATFMGGNGTTAVSSKATNSTFINLIGNQIGFKSTNRSLFTLDIFSYKGSTYKTCLYENNSDFNGTGSLARGVGLWRSTSAITSITFSTDVGNNFNIGTTATLYGILAA